MLARALFIVSLGMLLLGAGCQRGAPEVSAGDSTEGDALYPAFFLSLDGELPFRTISFKDVSQRTIASDPSDPVYEALAESLGYAIAASSAWASTAQVSHDMTLADPANHRFCGDRHLYVDVWRSEAPERLGYSLWSGCNEHDQFAWHELTTPWSEARDLVGLVEPLSESIVDSVRAAMHTGCFKAAC